MLAERYDPGAVCGRGRRDQRRGGVADARKDISVVPVVDNPKDRRYLGTISDRDVVMECVASGHDPKTCKCRRTRARIRLS